MRDELEARLKLEGELVLAADRSEFELFYQPQVSLIDGRLTGAEALIRWRHPDRGLILPADFMPVVNTSPISVRVAFWVMETACRQALLWQQTGHNVRIAVNLSASQLQSGDLVSTHRDGPQAHGLSRVAARARGDGRHPDRGRREGPRDLPPEFRISGFGSYSTISAPAMPA